VQGAVAQNAAICKKYSLELKLNNLQLITAVVGETVIAVAGSPTPNPLTVPFFNGMTILLLLLLLLVFSLYLLIDTVFLFLSFFLSFFALAYLTCEA
jgi:hypothetical protein